MTNPVYSQQFNFTQFNGALDFGGTSGASTGVVTAAGSNSFVSTIASDLSLFSAAGGGNINLGLNATGFSFGTGSGNLVTQFSTSAMGSALVTYTYTVANEVPEPASLVRIVAGLGLLAARRRCASKQA